MLHRIAKRELVHAQIALFVAIGLQLLVWEMNDELLVGPQYLLIPTEIFLALLIGFTVNRKSPAVRSFHHLFAVVLPALITVANISSLVLVLNSLIGGTADVDGVQLLVSALAIFMTNVIVFALWYWEIDSPGLTRKRWSKHDKDFHFPQHDLQKDFPDWRPELLDYLYLSVTNAINFAPSDTKPLTHSAKTLMGIQALVSLFTLAIVIARSVSILGS